MAHNRPFEWWFADTWTPEVIIVGGKHREFRWTFISTYILMINQYSQYTQCTYTCFLFICSL